MRHTTAVGVEIYYRDLGACQLMQLMSVTVTVKESVEHRRRHNPALELIVGRWARIMKALRNVLVNALMRPLLIEVVGVSGDDAVELVSVEDEEIISTLAVLFT